MLAADYRSLKMGRIIGRAEQKAKLKSYKESYSS
jgi:hypothetical protein